VFDPARHNGDEQCYNLFEGYNPHTQTPLTEGLPAAMAEYRARMLRPFFDLGRELFGGLQPFLDFFLKCIAFVIQHPQQKHPYCFILTGKQGTGKNVFLDAFGRLVGSTHFYSTTNPDDLFGTHAEGFVHKVFVVMNECEGKATFMYEGKLKGAISDVEMTVNAKCLRPVVMKNLAFIIVASNKPNPVQIDVKSGDRRFLCAKSTDKYLDATMHNDRFWTKLVAHLMKPEFIRCLYDYLNGLDVSKVDWKRERKANLGQAYKELAALYSPVEALYFAELAQLVKHGQHGNWLYMPTPLPATQPTQVWGVCTHYKKSEVYHGMSMWAKDHGFFQKAAPSAKQFYNKLAELDLPIRTSSPYNGIARFEFDPEAVHKHLVDKKFVEVDKPDEPEPEDADADALREAAARADALREAAAQDALFDVEMDPA
jgi:hypothetical protein